MNLALICKMFDRIETNCADLDQFGTGLNQFRIDMDNFCSDSQHFGTIWWNVGPIWTSLGPIWTNLAPIFNNLGRVRATWGRCRRIWNWVGPCWTWCLVIWVRFKQCGTDLEQFGTDLELNWGNVGSPLSNLGPIWKNRDLILRITGQMAAFWINYAFNRNRAESIWYTLTPRVINLGTSSCNPGHLGQIRFFFRAGWRRFGAIWNDLAVNLCCVDVVSPAT